VINLGSIQACRCGHHGRFLTAEAQAITALPCRENVDLFGRRRYRTPLGREVHSEVPQFGDNQALASLNGVHAITNYAGFCYTPARLPLIRFDHLGHRFVPDLGRGKFVRCERTRVDLVYDVFMQSTQHDLETLYTLVNQADLVLAAIPNPDPSVASARDSLSAALALSRDLANRFADPPKGDGSMGERGPEIWRRIVTGNQSK